MKYPTFFLAFFFGLVSLAHAKCSTLKSTIFSCTTTKGKFVEVCDAGVNISYSFGKLGATPELALQIPRERVTTNQWNGMGGHISYGVNIPYGNTNYGVFFSADRNDETHEIEAGLNVEVNEKIVSTIKCVVKNLVNNMEGVNLPEAK
jgi:hypothetical protein